MFPRKRRKDSTLWPSFLCEAEESLPIPLLVFPSPAKRGKVPKAEGGRSMAYGISGEPLHETKPLAIQSQDLVSADKLHPASSGYERSERNWRSAIVAANGEEGAADDRADQR